VPAGTRRSPTLRESYQEHAGVLKQMREQLALVSDGQVLWPHGRGGQPVAWSSAHEAAVELLGLAMESLVGPLASCGGTGQDELARRVRGTSWESLALPCERSVLARHLLETRSQSLALSPEQVADWQERIRRERGKLLALADAKPDGERMETGNGKRLAKQDDELPWGGPAWDELEPLLRRMLRYMHDRGSAQVENFTDAVWEKNDVTPNAMHVAISRANDFLAKQNHAHHLQKVRGQPIIRWV
jgi:hypothetical protein